MNLQERLEQCRVDKTLLEEQEKKLLEQIEEDNKLKVGDLVRHKDFCSVRVILFSEKSQCLAAFNKRGKRKWINLYQYIKIGKNIFTDNLLNLDY